MFALRGVQQLRVFGARYAAEFSGKARVRASSPPTREKKGPQNGPRPPPNRAAENLEPPSSCPNSASHRHPRSAPRRSGEPSIYFYAIPQPRLLPLSPPHLAPCVHLVSAAQQLGIQTCVEATSMGLFFAVWWRISHSQEKARYDELRERLQAAQRTPDGGRPQRRRAVHGGGHVEHIALVHAQLWRGFGGVTNLHAECEQAWAGFG